MIRLRGNQACRRGTLPLALAVCATLLVLVCGTNTLGAFVIQAPAATPKASGASIGVGQVARPAALSSPRSSSSTAWPLVWLLSAGVLLAARRPAPTPQRSQVRAQVLLQASSFRLPALNPPQLHHQIPVLTVRPPAAPASAPTVSSAVPQVCINVPEAAFFAGPTGPSAQARAGGFGAGRRERRRIGRFVLKATCQFEQQEVSFDPSRVRAKLQAGIHIGKFPGPTSSGNLALSASTSSKLRRLSRISEDGEGSAYSRTSRTY